VSAVPSAADGRRPGPTDNDNGYQRTLLSTNPAAGLENIVAEAVRGDLAEPVIINPVRVRDGPRTGLRMVYRPPRIS
jgi:hypothetical protein